MKFNTPLFIALRVVVYSLFMFGIAQAIYFDAAHPMEDGYFGEITLTEIFQEIILFALFIFYMILGFKWRDIQPISNIVSLFFLISFIREFNFIIDSWIYPVLIVFIIIVWLVFRDFNKIKQATITFFNQPASAWFFSGFLVTYIFSRLFGRSSFWRLLYDENNYRLAKAATEEGIELLGVAIMLIAAIEFSITFIAFKRNLKS
ncbi:MAG: hypothetical protein HN778_15580 [Prolixibacteraceae bacterium]|jgi:hypothetical protein|nr:hypothetical protein [Prolixibacteraceae bacterium]MBT6006599.1 hypothetical protein [Prolixibacteraceae bacterium]MBT6767200.1 hypothetical protein [Prolixibacteraceae bacterium]MBT6997813.1 hypothetical protein [Prolixibacteraceae bacterium]MBT7396251.1 hypothetical protein [Prolixibacteraceae bacterium]